MLNTGKITIMLLSNFGWMFCRVIMNCQEGNRALVILE